MTSRRLALVIGSQCSALAQRSFLPAQPGPVAVDQLLEPQRLLVRLRDLLVAGPGECTAVEVAGQSDPGLLLNPTKATADAALTEAIRQAHQQEAVLVVHFLGHGTGQQADPAAPAQHLLHVWDTVATPIDTEPESNGWDPYDLINRRRLHAAGMVGLVLLVDACRAAWAKQQVDAWGGVHGGLRRPRQVHAGQRGHGLRDAGLLSARQRRLGGARRRVHLGELQAERVRRRHGGGRRLQGAG